MPPKLNGYWIRLRFVSCRTGFDSQAHHLHFAVWENNGNKQKQTWFGPFLKNYAQRKFTLTFLFRIGPRPEVFSSRRHRCMTKCMIPQVILCTDYTITYHVASAALRANTSQKQSQIQSRMR